MKVLMPLFCLMNFIWAADSDAQRQQEVINIQKGAKPEDVPAYQGVNVPESHLNHRTITSAKPAIEGQEGAEFIHESFEKRPKVTIDPVQDPIFINASDALKNAESLQTQITQPGDLIKGSRDQRLAPPDQNFADAASKLAIFGEMQNDIKNFTGAGDLREPKIFKGDQKKCRKNGVMNCCGSEKGSRVAVSVKLARCTADEHDLFQKRVKGQCHYVGEYCALKVPLTGVCRLWKQSFCCFPSKLSRIVHEQGRPQINMDWGWAKYPSCSGFTVNSLQRLDFSKFDLSEFFDDIQTRTKIPDPTLVTSQLSNRFQTMTSNQTNNTKEGEH